MHVYQGYECVHTKRELSLALSIRLLSDLRSSTVSALNEDAEWTGHFPPQYNEEFHDLKG